MIPSNETQPSKNGFHNEKVKQIKAHILTQAEKIEREYQRKISFLNLVIFFFKVIVLIPLAALAIIILMSILDIIKK